MRRDIFSARAKIWLYPGMAGWHFISVPKNMSREISTRFGVLKRGWGSLRVQATIGKTSWDTSIFPDRKTGTYLFPIKLEVRKKEKVAAGKTIAFSIRIKT